MRVKSCHNACAAEEPLHNAFGPEHNRRVHPVHGGDGQTELVVETLFSPIPRVTCFRMKSAVE